MASCHTCGNSWQWHEENNPIHPFNNGEAGATAFLTRRDKDGTKSSPQRPQTASFPFDPVLRQALIDKGVLDVDDLRMAEEKIRAVTAQFLGRSNGEGEVQVGTAT